MVSSNAVSDLEIVRLIRDDPQLGYSRLLQQYGGQVRGYLRRRFPSFHESDVQDAVTDAMLRLADSFDPQRGALPAWFLLLSHQQAVGLLRSSRNEMLTESQEGTDREPSDFSTEPLAVLETVERLREVRQAIQQLPALERAVLEADLAEGQTVAARPLADRLGTTDGSIYAARKRARSKLIDRCEWVRDWLESGNADHG